MPFDTPTLPTLIGRTQADLDGDALRQSDAQVLSRAVSGLSYGLYGYLDWIAAQILPDSADEETLERQAVLRLRVPRKPAVPAAGDASFTAAAGALLDAGVLLQANDGRQYQVIEPVTAVAGSNTAQLRALAAGSLGNADAGLRLQLVSPVLGVASEFRVHAPGLTGGSDREDIESLRERVIRSYRVIPHGGAPADYETWALEVAGVTRAWSRRNYLGPGTVAVFVMRDGGLDPQPGPAELAAVQAHIEAQRPVTADLYVLAPVAVPIFYQLHVSPDTAAVRAAVESQLRDLHQREAAPGSGLLISRIRAAISAAAGEQDHVLYSPVANLEAAPGELLTFGGVAWQ